MQEGIYGKFKRETGEYGEGMKRNSRLKVGRGSEHETTGG